MGKRNRPCNAEAQLRLAPEEKSRIVGGRAGLAQDKVGDADPPAGGVAPSVIDEGLGHHQHRQRNAIHRVDAAIHEKIAGNAEKDDAVQAEIKKVVVK